MSKVHRRVVYNHGTIPLPSKALCGSSGKRTSKDDEVTCNACRKRMEKAAPKCSTCDDTGIAVYPMRLCGDCEARK